MIIGRRLIAKGSILGAESLASASANPGHARE